MTRLDQFLDLDDRARDRVALVSAVSGALLSVVARVVAGIEGEPLAFITIGGFGLAYVTQVWRYCTISTRQPVAAPETILPPRRLAMLAAAAGIFVLFRIVPPTVVEAAVVDRRLRKATESGMVSINEAEETASNLDIAWANRLQLSTRTQSQVVRAILTSAEENPNEPSFVSAAAKAISYQRTIRVSLPSALVAGLRDAMKALEVPLTGPANPHYQNALNAISELTNVIHGEASHPDVLTPALSLRGAMYLITRKPDEALADANRLESIGGDLADIVAIKGSALFVRGTREDVEQAIRLFTLAIELPPPTWATSADALFNAARLIEAYGNRGKAYYKLGEFQNCIEDNQTVLDLLQRYGVRDPLSFDLAYGAIIASYLQLGDLAQAKREAQEWVTKVGEDPKALAVLQELSSNSFDSKRWLEQYDPQP